RRVDEGDLRRRRWLSAWRPRRVATPRTRGWLRAAGDPVIDPLKRPRPDCTVATERLGSQGGDDMRVAMLTGGGDCPGLNAVMRAVARKAERVFDDELVGFQDGWRGVIDNVTVPLSVESYRGTLPRGGTILGSSRTNPFKVDGGVDACQRTLEQEKI